MPFFVQILFLILELFTFWCYTDSITFWSNYMKLDYLEIGEIVGTHGVRGELRLYPWCDSPEFVKKFKTLYWDGQGSESVSVLSCRPHGGLALLVLEGIESVEQAQALRGRILYMKRSDAKLPKGSYFLQELFGCRVIDADKPQLEYGVLSDVSKTGANDVWHIKKDDKEYLLPAIKQVVASVDIEANIVKIRPMKGIFDDAD